MWRFIIAIPLIMHGLANLAGVATFLFGAQAGFEDKPWLISKNVLMKSWIGRLWGLFWLVSSIFLVSAGIGAILQAGWWLTAAVIGCAFSLLSIAPWWHAVVPGARFGAIFDLIALVVLLSPLGAALNQLL
ncbi:MAG: hypothetical protein JXB15_14025 [Anaerolineales bacterium]|nr:hypothetical protein [Anaerolineales bacterium]